MNLANNELGSNVSFMKILGSSLLYMYSLDRLELYLQNNNLGENIENLKYLRNSLKYL